MTNFSLNFTLQGDSGGPVVYEDNEQFILVGVIGGGLKEMDNFKNVSISAQDFFPRNIFYLDLCSF